MTTELKMTIDFEWSKINYEPSTLTNENRGCNIILKNKILKMENTHFSLRTLGIEIELSILMAGDSNLWVFTRCKDEININSVVCQISKEQKSMRKFISFAIMDTSTSKDENTMNIKTLKKQEIPKQGKLYNSVYLLKLIWC